MVDDSSRWNRFRGLVRPIRRGFGASLLLMVLVMSGIWLLALVSQVFG
jgi:hypothetical protein